MKNEQLSYVVEDPTQTVSYYCKDFSQLGEPCVTFENCYGDLVCNIVSAIGQISKF